ncbi:hypothetical protein [Nitrosococcus watsonii]|uniref:hypothetical protein n=1 Tax=Nitrosococcus watsonii TaxID=473531 RepID=UPI0018DFA006|nr:hypothetical protein [Nitrosococcus watsonii]
MFGPETRVIGAAFKEIFECCPLVAKALLQRYTSYLVEEFGFRFFLHGSQPGICVNVANFSCR